MKRLFFVFIFLFAILFSYFYRKNSVPLPKPFEQASSIPSSTSTPTPEQSHLIAPSSLPLPAAIPKASPTPDPKLAVNPLFTTKPKDMNVPFEMAQGFAVTYGDTLLGKPTSDFTGSTGITEIKHPQLWDHGIIPYTIKPDVPNPQRIQQAIEVFNQRTSVKFVPYEGQADALVFEKGEEHCYSYLGKIGGLQPLFLSDRCAQAQIEHELMHALGFIHEQSRTDRDQFIDVLWPNIEEKYQSQFAIVPDALMDYYFDSPFDPDSIMMYDSHAFAVKPELTTLKIKNTGAAITPRTDLDESDVQRVNRLYHHSP